MNPADNKGGLQIKKELHQITIEKPWSRTTGGILVAFSIVWTSIASFIGSGFIESIFYDLFSGEFHPIQLIFAFFGLIPLAFIALGICMFFVGIAMLLNKTTILVEGDLLTTTHGPLPIIRQKQRPKQAIKQIFVQEIVTNRSPQSSATMGSSYQLAFINPHNQIESLFGSLFGLPIGFPSFTLEEAQQLEKLLEDYFGIEDHAVENEVRKNPLQSGAALEDSKEKFTLSEENLYRTEESPYHPNETPYFESEANKYPTHEKQAGMALIAAPKSLIIEENIDGLFIFKKWRSPIAIFYLVFGAIWNSVVWTAVSLIFPLLLSGNSELWLFALFLLPFIGVGIYILFSAFAIIFNTTTIHAKQGELIINHAPLPAGKNHRIPVRELIGLEVKSEQRRSKNRTYWVHSLMGIRENGTRFHLLKANSFMNFSEEETNFLNVKLSRYLHLKD